MAMAILRRMWTEQTFEDGPEDMDNLPEVEIEIIEDPDDRIADAGDELDGDRAPTA